MLTAKEVARVFEYLSIRTVGTPIEKTCLNKLLYFAQGHALIELNRELFVDQIDAWQYGPVVPNVFTDFDKIIDQAKSNGISGIKLSSEEMDFIMDVWEQYRPYTATELVSLTHESDTPWSAIYRPKERNSHIPLFLMKEYFSRPENKLKRVVFDFEKIPIVTALPAEDYDPEEDSVWEALLDEAQ